MMERSPHFLHWRPGDHTRLAGKMQFHYRLRFAPDGRPMLQVFNTCKHFIRTIPNLVYDESNVEDIDTRQEDHIYDECRYVLMENPISPPRRSFCRAAKAGRPAGAAPAGAVLPHLKKQDRKERTMEDTRAESLPIGAAEAALHCRRCSATRRRQGGKAALDRRLVDHELWFRMGHWKNYQNPMMPGKAQPSSGWLFNSIANKHADAMDNYPEPMVLPRAADDQATAQALSSVLPVVLEQADYEQVYSDVWWRKLKQGTGVTGIFWDPAARGGLGDIAVRSVNLLMLYWEPGVQDIQDSPDLFHLSLRTPPG